MNRFLQELLEEIKAASIKANLQSELTDPSTEYSENIAKLQQFFNTIQRLADLDGETLQTEESYWNAIKDNIDSKTFWNESIQNLIQLYERIYNATELPTEIETSRAAVHGKIISSFNQTPPQTFNTEDIRNGDAGNSFEQNSDWVKPWYNADKIDSTYQKSYSAVRGDDKAAAALTNSNNLQFTRDQAEDIVEQIRLLMPKNTRRVEIEDLNRNFWVIAQIITGISAYIFGEGSPYIGLLEGILKELVQLWENMIYQWIGIDLLLTETVSDIHIEFMPIPVDQFRPYKKYDYFDDSYINPEQWEGFIQPIQYRLSYLKDKYKKSNLIIIPYFRYNNYQKNYYGKIVIPYIVFYNRGAEEWKYCKLAYNNKPLIINPEDYKDFLYGARELPVLYRYTYPISYASEQHEQDGAHRYYGAIRPIPNILATVENGKIKIENFILNLADGVKNIIDEENESLISRYTAENITEDMDKIDLTYEDFTYPSAAIKLKTEKAERGYYLCEMPSCFCDSLHKNEYDVIDNTIIGKAYMMRVANFFSSGLPTDQIASGAKVPASDPSIAGRWTYERSGGSAPTEYLWNLAFTTYPYPSAGLDFCLYQPYYDNGEIRVRNLGARTSITYAQMKEIAQQSLSDFIINNRHLSSDNGFYIEDFSNGYGTDEKDKNAGITYFFTLIGVSQGRGTTGYGNPDSFISHCFRFIPKRLEVLVDINRTTPLIENINGHDVIIGYLQYLGKINKSTSYNVLGIAGYINSGLHLQQLFGEQEVANYIAIHINDDINGFIDFYQLPEEIQREYQAAGDDKELAAQVLINYLDTLTQDQVDELVKTVDDIKQMIAYPTLYWQDYDGFDTNTQGNIDVYKPNLPRRQFIKMELKSYKNLGTQTDEFIFYPSYLCCRRVSSSYDLKNEKKLYSRTAQEGYTYGGTDENNEYYKWTGQEPIPLTYEQVFISYHSLEDNQHFSPNWTGEN